MDAMDDRYNYASPLTGHQDPVPNSDAARLRLDSPAVTNRKRSGRTLPPPSLDPGLQPTVTRLDSTNTFINGTVTLSPLLVHSVGQK
jgi:hypothetical protein